MIGRLSQQGVIAEVGLAKVLLIVAAGLLLATALIAEHWLAARWPAWAVIALCGASLAITAGPIIWGAVRGLCRLETNVDELVSLAIVACTVLGEWITAAAVAWLMVLGSLAEELTSQRARRRLEALAAGRAPRAFRQDREGELSEVAVDELRPGDHIVVRPGDVVPADGTVRRGRSEVDESLLTGESLPVSKQPGDALVAGTINLDGALEVEVERAAEDSTQQRILEIIRDAERHRAPILRAAEAYARWFTPAILLLAALTWLLTRDLERAVTMLIVGCPCAFVLATPTAIVAALARASQSGILVKGGKHLEACAQVTAVAFDKTGTLTTGALGIREVIAADGTGPEQVLAVAAALEHSAEHPVARAIVRAARQRGLEIPEVESMRRRAGLGVEGVGRGGEPLQVGNRRFMASCSVDVAAAIDERAEALSAAGLLPVYVARRGACAGLIALQDELRPDAAQAIAELQKHKLGLVTLLSGDHAAVAGAIARQAGIPPDQVFAELLPQDKVRQLAQLEESGRRVCFVGDGSNDGPALARASVGVSIASREDTIALETADVVLLRDSLLNVPLLLRLGRATARTIRHNLVLFGLLFNATMLVLAGSGVLSPALGALGHNVGSVAVVLSSARLLRFR